MKTTILFISFMSSTILAGIGCEDQNTTALIAGLIFLVLTVLLVFNICKNETHEKTILEDN